VIPTYRRMVLDGMARLASRLDRRRWSPTFGCFDREYWHYKTLLDFPRAVFQQGALATALLYRHPFPENPYAGSPEVLQWVRGAMEFWAGARNADGSVNEWYPNEHSFCATAYTAYAVSEALILVGKDLDHALVERLRTCLRTTAEWLAAHANPWVANQMAASLAALANVHHLTGEERLGLACERRKAELLGMQDAEGWLTEYEGADIGYGFLTLDLLVHVWRRTQDVEVRRMADRLLAFLLYFVHPDGSVGGDYGSRSTTHCFPYGLEILAAEGSEQACWALQRVRAGIEQHRTPTPLTADDTYAAYFYLNSFCQAGLAASPVLPPGPATVDRNRYFPGAGLLVRENAHYHAIVSTRGVWQAYGGGEVHGDSGYVAVGADGTRLGSQFPGATPACAPEELGAGETRLTVTRRFVRLDTDVPLTRHAIAFKLFTRLVLRLPALALPFAMLLKKRKILRARAGGIELHRAIRLSDRTISVEDTLRLLDRAPVAALHAARGTAVPHSPSSQLFTPSVLPLANHDLWDAVEAGRVLTTDGCLSRRIVVDF